MKRRIGLFLGLAALSLAGAASPLAEAAGRPGGVEKVVIGKQALAADPKSDAKPDAPAEAADKLTKGDDGWYTVEFQVGHAKVKAEFPGEPKLESEAKNVGERLYTFTTAKGARYVLHVTDGDQGKVLPDEDKGAIAAEVTLSDWKKNDPHYKALATQRRGAPGKIMGMEFTGKDDRTSYHGCLFIAQGGLVLVSLDEGQNASPADQTRFFRSVTVEKGEEVVADAPKVEAPKDWVENKLGKTGLSVWAPMKLDYSFRADAGGGIYGEHALFLKDGKDELIRISVQIHKDASAYEGLKNNIRATVPSRAIKTTLGGVPGFCSFKDGKPVGKEPKFTYAAFIDNDFVGVRADPDKLSPDDAEKVVALLVQQLKK